jgi:hypothetical protein
MRLNRLLALLVVLAWSALVLGCLKPPPTRIGFNEQIAKSINKLAGQGAAFRSALEPLNKGQGVNARSAADALSKTIAEVEKQAEELSVPGKASASAPEFLKAYQDFVKAERQLYDTNVKTILSIAEGPGDPKSKWAQIEKELQGLSTAEQVPISTLKAAQKKYVDEHNFRTVQKHAS